MKKILLILMMSLFVSPAFADMNAEKLKLIKEARAACGLDVKEYCSKVTEGGGRMIACLYGHADKISSACEYQMFKIANAFSESFKSVNEIADACMDDIDAYCDGSEPGQGRIINCLIERYEYISRKCYKTIAR